MSTEPPRTRSRTEPARMDDCELAIAAHSSSWRAATASQPNTRTGPARHTTVADTTLVAVLDAARRVRRDRGRAQRRAVAHDRDYWAALAAPTIVGRSGVASSFWVHVTHGDPAGLWIRLEDGSRPHRTCGSWKTTGPHTISTADWSARPPSSCPPTCRWDITGCTFRSARSTSRTAGDRLPASLDLPPGWARAGHGAGHPALQRAFETILGHRRFDRSDRPGGVVGARGTARVSFSSTRCTRRHRPRRWSRRRTCRHRAGSSIRCICASRRYAEFAVRPAARPHPQGACRSVQARAETAERIDRDAAWKAKRAALESVYRRRSGRPGGSWRTPRTASARGRSLDDFATWCCARRGVRQRLAPVARGTAASGQPSGRRLRRRARRAPSTFTAGCSGSSTTSSPPRRPRPCRRAWTSASCTTSRSASIPNGADAWALQDVLALGVTAGAPPDEFNQLGQDWSQPPWRPDQLVERRVRAVPRPGQRGAAARGRRSRSTTSSGCSGCGGSRRAPRRPTAPTCATTTRR